MISNYHIFALLFLQETESAIECLETGQPVDLSSLSPTHSINKQPIQQPELNDSEARKLFKAPEPASSMLDALNQRKQKLEATLVKEQAANNSSKVRMMTRLIKQYDQAIKANKTGRPFDYSSLPELPGFDELPLNNVSRTASNPTPISRPSEQTPVSRPPMNQPAIKPIIPDSKMEQLEKSKDEFKRLALDAKRNGDLEGAKLNLKKMKVSFFTVCHEKT